MAQTWLVTGGCGFLGSNLAASLLKDGHNVLVADALVRLGAAENLAWLRRCAQDAAAAKLTFVDLDVRSRTDVEDLFARHGAEVTTVAHLAGQVAMTTSMERPRYDFEVNVLGSINVLEAVRLRAPHAVVLYSSTNKVYGDLLQMRYSETATRWTLPDYPAGLPETVTLDFHSPYGCSKGAADQYCLDYHRMYELKTVVFRHSSMYGGRQFSTYDQGWVGWFCQEFLRQMAETKSGAGVRPFTISGDGKQVRDLLLVDDAVQCYRQAAASPRAYGQAFNIGGGADNSLSLLELFEVLREELKHTPRVDKLPPRHSDQRVFIADLAKARELFEWQPQHGVRAGLTQMLKWLREPGAR